jgi:hypothetical protein
MSLIKGQVHAPRNALWSAFPFLATASIRADEDVVIPIDVAVHAFEGDWRPEAGQYVTGSLWLQAYALGLVT